MRISDWSSDVCSSDLSRVEPVRCGDCAGWTYVDAARAGAAVRGRRRIDRQRQVDVDFAEEEPRAAVRVDQAGVLADPAQARVARQRAFEHRGGIDRKSVV